MSVENEREKVKKRDYKRPELVEFGRADRLTDGVALPSNFDALK